MDANGGESTQPPARALFGCLRRRERWGLTWRGFAALLLLLLGLGIVAVREVHPFLASSQPLRGGLLVVEGWLPDYGLKAAMDEFAAGHYERLYVTGGPIERGAPLSEYKTYAELAAATLVKIGFASNAVVAVPTPTVQQDRTFTSALALRTHLDTNGIAHPSLNVMSMGPHARRSRLLFHKAFGKGTRVGIMALEPLDYVTRL